MVKVQITSWTWGPICDDAMGLEVDLQAVGRAGRATFALSLYTPKGIAQAARRHSLCWTYGYAFSLDLDKDAVEKLITRLVQDAASKNGDWICFCLRLAEVLEWVETTPNWASRTKEAPNRTFSESVKPKPLGEHIAVFDGPLATAETADAWVNPEIRHIEWHRPSEELGEVIGIPATIKIGLKGKAFAESFSIDVIPL
ncbi:MAG: hypothetical protein AAGA78_00530 [Pseudomonadota bacterium]